MDNKILKFPAGYVGTQAVKQVMLDQMTAAEIKDFFAEVMKEAKEKERTEKAVSEPVAEKV